MVMILLGVSISIEYAFYGLNKPVRYSHHVFLLHESQLSFPTQRRGLTACNITYSSNAREPDNGCISIYKLLSFAFQKLPGAYLVDHHGTRYKTY